MKTSSNDAENEGSEGNVAWWRWRWRNVPSSVNSIASPQGASISTSHQVSRKEEPPLENIEFSGWDRVKLLYTQFSMERDIMERAARMTFLGGFLVGGANGYALARQQYELTHKGTKYLSPSDAFKRRMDYGIVRFAKGGFSVGLKCAFISGSIIALSTHTAAYRRHFSSLYFPAFSGPFALLLHTVGAVFTFPVGVIGSAKAFGLGISSGLTLSAVCGLYALGMDRSVDSAYWHFKREYETGMREEKSFEDDILKVMEERKCWRYQAVKIVREEAERRLCNDDD